MLALRSFDFIGPGGGVQVVDLLTNADANMVMLGEKLEALALKVAAIGEKWEPHRQRLVEEYRLLKVGCPAKGGSPHL
jgi:hypothetical protein